LAIKQSIESVTDDVESTELSTKKSQGRIKRMRFILRSNFLFFISKKTKQIREDPRRRLQQPEEALR